MMPIFMTLHNVFSQTIVKEFAQTALAFGCKSVVITRAQGAAAMSGVPEAQKLTIKADSSLLFFRDLPDAIEIIAPDYIYLIISSRFSDREFDTNKIFQQIKDKKVMIVFAGSTPGLTRKELDSGEAFYIKKTTIPLNAVAELAIVLDRFENI